jgi:hypothetical protein
MWQFLTSPLRSFSDEHEKIQKKTFTKWINFHLETHSSSGQVNDLYEDLRDGVLLCHLIEVLTGEALPVNKARVSRRVHHVSNLTTALTVLRRRGLELINNNPTDLADGNPRIILGLIWQMVLHFQIEANLELFRACGWDQPIPGTHRHRTHSPFAPSTSTTPKGSKFKAAVDRVMLKWLQKEISEKYGISITDMDKSWRDGYAFLALVHRFRPDLVDLEEAKKLTPRENIERAFELARLHLNIRPLLEVDDVLHEKPDKRSIITYVSQFLRAPTGSEAIGEPLASTSTTNSTTKARTLEYYSVLIQWTRTTKTEVEERRKSRGKSATNGGVCPSTSSVLTDFEVIFCLHHV